MLENTPAQLYDSIRAGRAERSLAFRQVAAHRLGRQRSQRQRAVTINIAP